jgi:ParB-like chromosome segregation protein Spo0J
MAGPTGETLDESTIQRANTSPDRDFPSGTWLESQPVVMVRIDSLVFAETPRRNGADRDHIRLLADAGNQLPPIIVHRPTMRVIDGVHRVRAALLNDLTEIPGRLLDCDESTAFVLAVQANVTHGLPLSRADRAAAAARIVREHPEWSDRVVAEVSGLSDKTVSKIRDRSTADVPRTNARLGRDGRLRPLDSGLRRQEAAAMINERPDAALREVAQATGLSLATVLDVRQRIRRGEDPVPQRYRPTQQPDIPTTPELRPAGAHRAPRSRRHETPTDQDTLLAQMRRDPSLRFSETGRRSLRWLHDHVVDADGLDNLSRGLPDHWAPVMAEVARRCASAWSRLAEQLERRR